MDGTEQMPELDPEKVRQLIETTDLLVGEIEKLMEVADDHCGPLAHTVKMNAIVHLLAKVAAGSKQPRQCFVAMTALAETLINSAIATRTAAGHG